MVSDEEGQAALYVHAFLAAAQYPLALPAPQRGRPSLYTDELAQDICGRIAEGETLRTICDGSDGMPRRSVVFAWVRDNPDFRLLYYAAMAWRAESRADEVIAIADDASEDNIPVTKDDGTICVVANKTAINRAKIQINTRFRLMAAEAPRKYGVAARPDPEAPANGDGARVINNTSQIENHPLYEQIIALEKIGAPKK